MRTQLKKALVAAGGALESFAKRAAVIGGGVVVAGTAISGALTLAANKFSDFGDQLHKMGLRTGASAEFLSEMKFAAEQSGASIEALGDVMQKMNRRFGRVTAGQGSATQTKAVEELGLSIDELRKMSPEERFMAFAEAMKNYGDRAAAAGLAQRIFGTGVDKLLPLIWEGREGIEKLREEARSLGLAMSQDDVNAAAAYADAMNRLKRSMEAVWTRIGAAVAPALTDLANRMAQNVTKVVDWINTNQDLIANALRVETAIAGMKVAWAGMIVFWRKETSVFREWFAGFTEDLAGAMIEAVAAMKRTWAELLATLRDPFIQDFAGELGRKLGLGGRLAKLGKAAAKGSRAVGPTPEQVNQERDAAFQALRDEFARRFKNRQQGGSGVAAAEKDLADAMARLNKLLGQPRKRSESETAPDTPISGALSGSSRVPLLTATYSAAAAQIGGYQGASPEEKTAEAVVSIDKNIERVLVKIGEWIAQNGNIITLYERFLSGWQVN